MEINIKNMEFKDYKTVQEMRTYLADKYGYSVTTQWLRMIARNTDIRYRKVGKLFIMNTRDVVKWYKSRLKSNKLIHKQK